MLWRRGATAFRSSTPGHVWLAGAGPGDPGLLTLDALAGLQQADVVVHDALVDQRVLALAGQRRRGSNLPASAAANRRRCRPTSASGWIALARDGHRVLRLKGGDPFVFGRGGEEAMALAARRHSVPHHSRRHRRPRGARRSGDPGDAARRQPRRHLRGRPRRRRGFRLGAARAHRPADRAVHGDAQSRRIAAALMRGRARAANARRRSSPRQRRRRARPRFDA